MDLQSQDNFFSSSDADAAASRLSPITQNQHTKPTLQTDMNPAQNSVVDKPSRRVVPSSPLHDATPDSADCGFDDAGRLRRNSSCVDVAESFLLNTATDNYGNSPSDIQGAGAAGSQRDESVEDAENGREYPGARAYALNVDAHQRPVPLIANSSNSPAVISHSQSHDGILSSSSKDASAQFPSQHQQQHFRPQHARNASAGGESLSGSKLPHKNLLTYTMEDQAILMKTRMRSLSLPYALKVKSPETIAKESGM